MLAIAGGKGGCGKTTTTLGLAGAVARRGERVVALDADVDMPDLHTVAGTKPTPGADALAAGAPIEDAIQRASTVPGVDVVAAPTDSAVLADVLQRLARGVEHVLVDTPAGASVDVCRAIEPADRSILVTTPTRESVRDAAKTAALARTLGTNPIGTVLTRSDGAVDPSAVVDCETLVHVPAVKDPTRDPAARAAYETCVCTVTKRNV